MDTGGEPVRVMLRRMRGMPLAMRSVMPPAMHWCAIVGAFAASGMLVGWGTGMSLSALSGDYVLRPSEYVHLGLRTGLFAGTLIAAWRFTTRQPLLTLREHLGTFIVITLCACGLICVLWVLALSLSPLHGLFLNDANLGHPRRHFVFALIHHVWPYAWMVGIVLGGMRLWRSRPGSPGTPAQV